MKESHIYRYFTRIFNSNRSNLTSGNGNKDCKDNKDDNINHNHCSSWFDQQNLQLSYYQQLFENYPEGIAMLDSTDRIINVNKGFERLFGYKLDEIKGYNINNLLVPDPASETRRTTFSILAGKTIQNEYIRKRKDGSFINVSILTFPIMNDNNQIGFYTIYSDITDRIQAEEKLLHLGIHDPLTGLYNRTFFEEQMKNYDLRIVQAGIIVCDVNGLKIINDSLGHKAGDTLLVTAANVIRSSLRSTDIVARIGGDEFTILLPYSNAEDVKRICLRIQQAIAKYNTNSLFPLSISLGWAVAQNTVTTSMDELFKEADNNMYREKMKNNQNTRKAIIDSFMSALETKDFITMGHVVRLQKLIQCMGKLMNLPDKILINLDLLAKYHDVGKVCISDTILFKETPLTAREIKEIHWHSEIGYRIAHSVPEFIPISCLILRHHERWDGKGYPLGISGETIPLECRIFALADAYDAMTNFRPYRKTLTIKEAVKEIKNCAGTQFDPNLINTFMRALCESKITKNALLTTK